MSPIRSKMEAESWLAERLREEGPDLWRDRQREELARKLAQDYRSGGSKWRVEEWTQRPEGVSVYVVTRGGVLGIHSVDDPEKAREKADAIVRALGRSRCPDEGFGSDGLIVTRKTRSGKGDTSHPARAQGRQCRGRTALGPVPPRTRALLSEIDPLQLAA